MQSWFDRSAEETLPDCEASKLESNLSLHRNGNNADVVAIVEVKNSSSQKCRVRGAQPIFRFWNGQTMTYPVKTCQNCTHSDGPSSTHFVVLAPGEYSHVSVQWKDSPQTDGPACVPVGGMEVVLYFPNKPQSTAVSLLFSAPSPQVCSVADFTSLTPGRDPYLGSANPASFGKLRMSGANTMYYPGEDLVVDVTMPTKEPLEVGKRCPSIFLDDRDSRGNNYYRQLGGEADWGCTVAAIEPDATILRVRLPNLSDTSIGDQHSLQFLQYSSTSSEKDAWRLMAQSGTFQYRVGDPKRMLRNWGAEVDGLALSIGLDKTTYGVGEVIPLHVAFWNIRANNAMTLPSCNWAERTVVNAKGERFDQVDGDLSCNFSGPCAPKIAVGSVVTAEQNLTDYRLPPGTYRVTGEWTAFAYLEDLKTQYCYGAIGKEPSHVQSNTLTLHVVAAKQP